MTTMRDIGTLLRSFSLEHPEADELSQLYRTLIETPAGVKELF